MRITVWGRKNRGRSWEHNHIESGWNIASAPCPKSEIQKRAWNNAEWKKQWGWLRNNKVKL